MTAYDTIVDGIKTKLTTISGLTVYLNHDRSIPMDIFPSVDIRVSQDDPYFSGGVFGAEIHQLPVQIVFFEQSGASPDSTTTKFTALKTKIFDAMNLFRSEMIASFAIEDMSAPTQSSPENAKGTTLFIAGALNYDIWYTTKIYGETR